MRSLLRIFLVSCFFFGTIVLTADESLTGAQNIVSCPIPGNSTLTLIAVNDPALGPIWGLLRGNILHFPPVDLAVSGREVVCLETSPDGEWLLAVAASEGHTSLAVFPVEELRNLPLDGEWQTFSPVRGYDGYPGNVSLKGWDGNRAVLSIDEEYGRDSIWLYQPWDGSISQIAH